MYQLGQKRKDGGHYPAYENQSKDQRNEELKQCDYKC